MAGWSTILKSNSGNVMKAMKSIGSFAKTEGAVLRGAYGAFDAGMRTGVSRGMASGAGHAGIIGRGFKGGMMAGYYNLGGSHMSRAGRIAGGIAGVHVGVGAAKGVSSAISSMFYNPFQKSRDFWDSSQGRRLKRELGY